MSRCPVPETGEGGSEERKLRTFTPLLTLAFFPSLTHRHGSRFPPKPQFTDLQPATQTGGQQQTVLWIQVMATGHAGAAAPPTPGQTWRDGSSRQPKTAGRWRWRKRCVSSPSGCCNHPGRSQTGVGKPEAWGAACGPVDYLVWPHRATTRGMSADWLEKGQDPPLHLAANTSTAKHHWSFFIISSWTSLQDLFSLSIVHQAGSVANL